MHQPDKDDWCCSAAGAFWGATLFVIGSFADIVPSVSLATAGDQLAACHEHQSWIARAINCKRGCGLHVTKLSLLQVHNSLVPSTGLHDSEAVLVLLLFCVGTYLFTLSCVLLYVVENNHGYTEAVHSWKLEGRTRRRPW